MKPPLFSSPMKEREKKMTATLKSHPDAPAQLTND
jgi:hypothetical protein